MSQTNHPADVRNLIYHIRGKAVMLDNDLARLYDVDTKVLNQAVTRHRDRFPEDFMFRLTKDEYLHLRSQFVTSRSNHGGRRYLPRVFTEQGVAMLSGILNSKTAIRTNIHIMRAFVQVRRLGMSIVDLKRKIDAMERTYDHNFKIVFDAIRQLMEPPERQESKIGFKASPRRGA